MLHHLLIAVGGVVGLFALWLGVQAAARHQARGAGECEGPDVTACRSCAPERASRCSMRKKEKDSE